jgi:hypothetical protein
MFSMKARGTAALLATAAALVPLGSMGATGATAAAPAKSKLTIQTQNGDFSGTIKSKKRKCMNDREVKVFRMVTNKKKPSIDEEVASDTASLQNGKGRWETGNTGLRDGKRYYAYTAKKPGCKAATSKAVRTVLDPETVNPEA